MGFTMKHVRSLIILGLLLAAAGCRTYPTYFAGHAPLATGTRLGLDQAYIAPDATAALTSHTLLVQVVDMRQSVRPEISKVGAKTDLAAFRPKWEEVLANVMWRARIFSDVSVPSDLPPIKNPDLRLDVALTGWDEGSGWLRYFFGILSTPLRAVGTGPTRVQWEGRLSDARTGAVLIEFADARIHPGGPSLSFLSLRPFRANELMEEDLAVSLGILADGLRDVCGVTAPMMSRVERHNRFHAEPARKPGAPKPKP